MTNILIDSLNKIDKLQGLIYQNLMETFNDISNIRKDNLDDFSNISNMQKLKHTVLSKITKTTDYINSPKFKIACITCKAVRILGLLKYIISSKYLSVDDHIQAVGQVITDYKIEKKYTEDFFSLTIEAKDEIIKFISSKQLRKKFHLNDFCIKLLNSEKQLITQTTSDSKEIEAPQWLENMSQQELEYFATSTIQLLENQDYEEFLKFTKDK